MPYCIRSHCRSVTTCERHHSSSNNLYKHYNKHFAETSKLMIHLKINYEVEINIGNWKSRRAVLNKYAFVHKTVNYIDSKTVTHIQKLNVADE
jgi:hypothetical protein